MVHPSGLDYLGPVGAGWNQQAGCQARGRDVAACCCLRLRGFTPTQAQVILRKKELMSTPNWLLIKIERLFPPARECQNKDKYVYSRDHKRTLLRIHSIASSQWVLRSTCLLQHAWIFVSFFCRGPFACIAPLLQ